MSNTNGINGGNSLGQNSIGNDKNTYGKVPDHRPAARDGHSGIIYEGKFVVFGGDRHHMPFNDLHFLHIEKEFSERGLLNNGN